MKKVRDPIAERGAQALRLAVREELERKSKLGQYVIVWRDGRTQRVPASDELARIDGSPRARKAD